MHKTRNLKKLMNSRKLLVVPGIYDALTSRIAQHCGFSAIYMTGYGTAASYGYPDFGLLTMSEMLENVRRISNAVEIPLIADADTGYGNYINMYRTVQEYEKAGAAAIQFEDQTWPKRCGHMEGKQVIDAEEMVTKIKAAVDARIYPETVLIVRTDAIGMYGFEEALRRGEMYIEAGADVLFIEAPANKDQIKKIPSCFSRPCLINMAFVNQNDVDVRTLKRWGYAIAIYPIVALLGAIAGCFRMFNSLKTTGKQGNWRDIPFDFDELNQFFGLDKFKKLERKFSLKFQNKERAD